MGPTLGKLCLTWGLVRLPILFVILYLLRYEIAVLGKYMTLFNISTLTVSAIDLVSTPAARAMYFVFLAIVLIVCLFIAKRFKPWIAYLSVLSVASALILPLFHATGTPMWRSVPPILVLATNLAPDSWLDRLVTRRRWWNAFMAAGVGVAELFFFKRYVQWLRELGAGRSIGPILPANWSAIPGILLASVAAAVLVSNSYLWVVTRDSLTGSMTWLRQVEQALRMSPAVRTRIMGDMHGIGLDATGRFLYVAGHGYSHLHRYSLADWSAPPLVSDIQTNYAQGFAYDAVAGELYAYDGWTRRLLYFDALTLRLQRFVSVPNLPPGDYSMVVDRRTDTIMIASEDDQNLGSAVQVLNRATGTALITRDEDSSILFLHPDRSVVYMSFFGRRGEIYLYDLRQLDVVRRQNSPRHMEGMAYWEKPNEILATVPLDSRVMRFDADTLAYKGYFDATFGVRSIALDRRRNLLVCAGVATGKVVVIDLTTGEQKASYYLGPWLRNVAIAEERGIAYVSSYGALYELDYLRDVEGVVR